MEYAIEVRNLTKRYKDFTLDDISFALPSGTVMGLIGENGAGKSTLINSILGIADCDSQLVSMLGLDMKTHGKKIKEDIAALFSGYLEKFGLPQKKKIKKMSTGMRVKLEFAAALSHHPKLLILDEATSGLDPVFRDEILDILREFTEDEGHAILMSSHITSDLDKIADYIAYLHEGKIQFIKTYDEIRSDYGIITCGQELFDSLSRDDIAAYKKGPYSYQVLIKNRGKVRQVFQDIEIANASVEDIMLFCAKGEQVK
ncbi:ATP-binding cassette domain-containing protein [Mediterraneibacter glycyrrhizinilyticus]|uniref:ABC transporter ATP-binding protein n=1 Tax=Mediterraneibacter glycyrrhizinilyticus TaxID=342942 RepID=UPI002659A3DE|nr:ATP-binding cassette domain-containing protein [Mediterraneibacter glycyrrhizinilyticus]MCF2569735.1 ATP-binding cassette domain-containing protein [Mediterraneibacter glycyrrhizinilyticus]